MRTPSRSAFTLVEMMVAMTLTIFVMVILSQCFVQGLETFSGLKAIGDMQEELRTASTLLRADLSMDHFEGKRRLSNPVNNFLSPNNIREGFFSIGSGYPLKPTFPTPIPSAKAFEGQEQYNPDDKTPSYRVTDHFLHFSVKMRGNAREKFFAAPALGVGGIPTTYLQKFQQAAGTMTLPSDPVFQESTGVIHSPWAEIVWLLLPTGTTFDPRTPPTPGSGAPGTKLCALYRCQYVVLPETADANKLNPPLGILSPNVAGTFTGNGVTFLSPNDLAVGWPRRTFNPYQYFSVNNFSNRLNNRTPPPGAALVVSNVISFQVMALTKYANDWIPTTPGALTGTAAWTATADFVELAEIAPAQGQGKYFVPFDTANYYTGLPVTAGGISRCTLPPLYSIQGLQIIIRIWDPKSRQARQVTIMQDM